MDIKYLKLKEAIRYSGMGRSTLHKLDRLGILVPFRSATNRRLYTKEMIDEYIKSKKEK
jgi:DNA-binding transcriptional MerR regulator